MRGNNSDVHSTFVLGLILATRCDNSFSTVICQLKTVSRKMSQHLFVVCEIYFLFRNRSVVDEMDDTVDLLFSFLLTPSAFSGGSEHPFLVWLLRVDLTLRGCKCLIFPTVGWSLKRFNIDKTLWKFVAKV